ncbi:hypothetical protein DL98DRAFT_145098 [Cadophora sp. DSE1049]|nr:hypothetical protein DL98DRAFT_145098 [Cadophora sp. DSE1049]
MGADPEGRICRATTQQSPSYFFRLPPMASLKIVRYKYVPTKRSPTRKQPRSIIGTQTGVHPSLQDSELDVLPETALQLPTAETPSDARSSAAGQLARRGIQGSVSVPRTSVSPGIYMAQNSLGTDADHAQVASAENDDIDIELTYDLNSIFGDLNFDQYLPEQEARPTIDNNDSCVANQNTDTPADQTDSWVSENEFGKTNTSCVNTHRRKERRGHAKRRRQNDSAVIIDSSGGGTSESDAESVFENNSPERSKYESWSDSFSLCCSGDEENAAKPTRHLRLSFTAPPVEFTISTVRLMIPILRAMMKMSFPTLRRGTASYPALLR